MASCRSTTWVLCWQLVQQKSSHMQDQQGSDLYKILQP